ncbi:MAG TPA: MBL fold metallo-hydrolase [Candidatus Saccharimonadales bacterium]|nr:MBL fold metallo-hydrolase [Candidatus Saccharimonadales bacterium]
MNITKYEHACFVVEDQGQKLVVDPGKFSESFNDFTGITAVVITHVHADHFDSEKVHAIAAANPDAQIFSTRQVAEAAADLHITVVEPGTSVTVGAFTLEFFGGLHAEVYRSIPRDQNVGVLINSGLYYPGDSFVEPGKPVQVLALPSSGPWLKVAESLDFLAAIKPKFAFPTHDTYLSERGAVLVNTRLQAMAESFGGTYRVLQPGETLAL